MFDDAYEYPIMKKWARNMAVKNAKLDLISKRDKNIRCLNISFEINTPVLEISKLIDWLETGLKVSSWGHGWEIINRQIGDKKNLPNKTE